MDKTNKTNATWIGRAHEAAAAKGGRCLSGDCANGKTVLEWECDQGHSWKANATSVINGGHWCKICGLKARAKGIEHARAVAKERGGECLSDECRNGKQKLKWKCEDGHTWEACRESVENAGTWCPVCKGLDRITNEDADKVAAANGGARIGEARNSRDPIEWKCSVCGHRWESSYSSAKQGHWCPECAAQARKIRSRA